MEYMIWLLLVVAIVGVIWWKRKEKSPSAEEQEAIENMLALRANAAINRFNNERHDAPNTRKHPSAISPRRSPPPAPPMRNGNGRPVKIEAPSALPRVNSVSNSNSDRSSMDLLTTVVVLDAVGAFDDEPVKTSSSSCSSSDDSGWSSSNRSDSGWSSSSDSSSSDSGSSSSSSSSCD